MSYSEDGSSDGDYVPDDEDDDEDDEDDGFMDTDGFDAEADFDLDLPSDDGADFDEVLQDIGLPAGFDMAADIEAFMEEHAAMLRERDARRRAPAAVTTAEEDIDAYLEGRHLFVGGPLPELPTALPMSPRPVVHMGFLPAPASLVREGSEAEVLRDLAGDAQAEAADAEGWGDPEDAAMENWGLSHSDEEASETLSEGELLRSMEDLSPQNDGGPVSFHVEAIYVYADLYDPSRHRRRAGLVLDRDSPNRIEVDVSNTGQRENVDTQDPTITSDLYIPPDEPSHHVHVSLLLYMRRPVLCNI